MISPEEVAAGLLPPAESEAPPAQVHRIADAAITLAEQLQSVVPDGRNRRAALAHLVRGLQSAYTALEPVMVPEGTEDQPIPYTVVADDQAEPADRTLDFPDVAVWRLGIQTSDLHPLSRLVALVLAEYARPSGYIPSAAQPTLTQLAARAGTSLGGAHVHMAELVAHGWVRLPNPR
jgi:hypothetical protein